MADTKLSPWKRVLRNASFRGVQFHVRDRDLEGGRRLHNHEFPKRNKNFPEDMGKATRKFSVDAYIIGEDYAARRNKLLDACEREGSGSYVDHWGVSQRVKCERFRLMESSDSGRMCRYRLDFIEDGGATAAAPVQRAATAVQLATAASGLATAATQQFNARFSR